jgi:hypothetical protein
LLGDQAVLLRAELQFAFHAPIAVTVNDDLGIRLTVEGDISVLPGVAAPASFNVPPLSSPSL